MNGKCCGRCEHFTLVDAPRAADGEGRCRIYGAANPEPLVRWDHEPTVLFWAVRGDARVERESWISQIRRREELANASTASAAVSPRGANLTAGALTSTQQ